MKLTSWLRDKFPYTYGMKWLCIYGASFAGFTAVFLQFDGEGNREWYSIGSLVITMFFFIGIFLIFIFELLAKFIPFFGHLLKFVAFIFRLLGKTYVFVLSIFLKPVVVNILEGNGPSNSGVTLKNTVDRDDDYINEIFEFDQIKNSKIKISSASSYWRLGMKFSSSKNFNESRVSQDHPLFHLAKDEQNNIVYRVYYDENTNQRQNENVIENYDGSPIIIEIDKKDGLRIVIKNAQGEELKSEKFPLELHKYGKLFAWGDRRSYLVKVNTENKKA